jgi:hypothetical protein
MTEFAEIWLPVEGFEAYYEVSNLGRVRSLDRTVVAGARVIRHQPGRVMCPAPDKCGYPRIIFRVRGKLQTHPVHRLVCRAFHGPAPDGRPEVHHIDRDRSNARADNLEWVSRSENLAHKDSRGERNNFSKLTEDAAREIKARRGEPAKDLAAAFGVRACSIYGIWSGKRWGHVQ